MQGLEFLGKLDQIRFFHKNWNSLSDDFASSAALSPVHLLGIPIQLCRPGEQCGVPGWGFAGAGHPRRQSHQTGRSQSRDPFESYNSSP